MAKTQTEAAGTAGSQFFIVIGPDAATLTPDYALLGNVTKGLDVAKRIGNFGDANGDSPGSSRSRRRPSTSTDRVAAIVLAAGASTRYGGVKQHDLLPTVLAALRETSVDEVVVVEGAHACP